MKFIFQSLALLAGALTALAAPASAPLAAAQALQAKMGKVVPDKYIVVLKNDLPQTAIQEHEVWATNLHAKRLRRRDDSSLDGITATYSLPKLKGYAGSFDEETIEAIKASGDVAYVEKDKVVVAYEVITQTDSPSWGISRVSQYSNPDLTRYYYDSTAGAGVTAYVIDTGVLVTHNTFQGRAQFGASFASGGQSDGNGHGTHVAGTIAGATFGIAKKANIVAVKVLGDDGSGSTSGVISGIQWVAIDASGRGISRKSVANMSLGGGYSAALNSAVRSAVGIGLTFVVAAGNSNANAANYSPASEPSAITVGSTDRTDTRSTFSNYGSSVDVFAPGTGITSSWIGSNSAQNTISGTSMASPHVAGVAAYLIAYEDLSGSAAVTARIKELSIQGVVQSPGSGSTNALLFSGARA